MSTEQLAQRANVVLPPVVVLLLVVALAWQLVRLTWMLFPREEAVLLPPPAAITSGSQTGVGSVDGAIDINRIAGAHLFGVKPEIPDNVPPPGESFDELDETQLSLTLRGTIAASENTMAIAIIADDRGEEKIYAIGDTVSNGRTLHSVLPDRAILNNRGELEALKLPREYDNNASPAQRSTRSSRARPSRLPNATAMQKAIANNPAKLTDLIRPQPVFSNGKQLGYRVYPGRRRQQFVQLGLKPGDLVTEINGAPLNDPAKGADIFRSLADSNQVTVTVERNGAPQVLVLDTDQLNIENDTEQ